MKDLTLYLVTFNCARNLIEPDIFGGHLLSGWTGVSTADTTLPDLIVLNLQEIAPIGYAFLGSTWVKPYFDRFREAVNIAVQGTVASVAQDDHTYINILAQNSGLTAIMIFVREDLVNEVRSLQVAEVGVGLSEMANKGAIGARLGWQTATDSTLAYTTFVSAHLAPFETDLQRRNQDYYDIAQRLVFSGSDAREWRKGQQHAEDVPLLAASETGTDADLAVIKGMYAADTYLFFAGDLNYRTAPTVPSKDDYTVFPQPRKDVNDPRHFSHLLEKDQLSSQRHLGRTLHGLCEQPINFAPTYKYRGSLNRPVLLDDDVDEWRWAEHRWPSWCDRILYAPANIKAAGYSSLPIFRTSDHRPVTLSVSLSLDRITDSQLMESAPAHLDPEYRARRDAARRKEIAVGIAAYLGLTWEGNSLLFGTVLMILGATYISKVMS